ncbi:hypothetical protein [Streptomyces sp. NPDC001530]|uniref:hypothetical protein n=1 Tax=Streptomyces sp. NPDC001530 TaxID=3364582 RepID=UPI00369BCBCC
MTGRLRRLRAAGLCALQDKNAAAPPDHLPAHTDAPALAAFYPAVLHRRSAQARDSAERRDPEQIAESALRARPSATGQATARVRSPHKPS